MSVTVPSSRATTATQNEGERLQPLAEGTTDENEIDLDLDFDNNINNVHARDTDHIQHGKDGEDEEQALDDEDYNNDNDAEADADAEMRRSIMGFSDFATPGHLNKGKETKGQKRKREASLPDISLSSKLPSHPTPATTPTRNATSPLAAANKNDDIDNSKGSSETTEASKCGLTVEQLDALRTGYVTDSKTGDRVYFMPSFIEDPWSRLLPNIARVDATNDASSSLHSQTTESLHTAATTTATATASHLAA